MNQKINGSQCTNIFYVDALKISHAESNVITENIEEVNKKYGDIMPLSVSRSDVHDYLRMTFDYSRSGQVWIHMY